MKVSYQIYPKHKVNGPISHFVGNESNEILFSGTWTQCDDYIRFLRKTKTK